MQILPYALFCILFAVALFAPLRWSLVAYIVLSAVDFSSGDGGVGILNTLKGVGYPIVLLWRLKHYAGHGKIVLAPVAWLALTLYAALAAFWSLFPLSAAKLAVEMFASFLICIGFMRATKAGFLTPSSVLVPAAAGVLLTGVLRSLFLPNWGDSPHRFTGFTTAQGYAALLSALCAMALGTRTVKPWLRWLVFLALFLGVILDGSRIYVIGILLSLLVALVVSYARLWVRLVGVASVLLVALTLIAAQDELLRLIARLAPHNRVADTITAVHQGNMRSTGVGTVVFRRNLYRRTLESIAESSLVELAFGHGTSNGRLLTGTFARGVGDPNRAVHNEWLRILYEWGGVGLGLWFAFIVSITAYAIEGARRDRLGYSRPLLIFLPAFFCGISTENILAGAGHAENIGFVLLIAIATVSHRPRIVYLPRPAPIPYAPSGPAPVLAAPARRHAV